MKKIFLLTVFVFLILIMSACKGADADSTGTNTITDDSSVAEETYEIITFLKDGASDYAIIRPDSYDKNSVGYASVKELYDAIKVYSGVSISSRVDYTIEDLSVYDGAKEILIGATNRKESVETLKTLKENDYVIKIVNRKLIILGGSEEKTVEAINRFKAMFFSADQPSLILKSNYKYEKLYDYAVSSMTINGKNISDYQIVYGKNNSAAAEIVAQNISKATGIILKCVSDSTEATECEILVGATTRSESAQTIADGSYIIMQTGNKLVLNGSTYEEVNMAARAFYDEFLRNPSETVTISAGYSKTQTWTSNSSLKLLDLNLYSAGYGENSITNRYPRLVELINGKTPDVMCFQDVSPTWLGFMTEGIDEIKALTEKYDYVGIGRNNDDESVKQTIFFDKSKYTKIEDGTFWLSQTPDWESVGWDGRSRNICTWVRLKDNQTNKEFVVMNTQLDFYGTNANLNGAKLICDRASDFDVPVIFAGDFQKTTSSSSYNWVVKTAFLDSASVAAEKIVPVNYTANNSFGNDPSFSTPSDFVFVSPGNIKVKSYSILNDKVDGKYISNHNAILVEAEY